MQPVGWARRLLSWPIALMACVVCLLGGLVTGLLIGRGAGDGPGPTRTAAPAGGPLPLPELLGPLPPLPEPAPTPRVTEPLSMPSPPVVPPPPRRPRYAAEVLAGTLRVFARPAEQLYAAPPRMLYCVLQVRLSPLEDAPVRVPVAGDGVQIASDSGMRFPSLGMLETRFDWSDPSALRRSPGRRTAVWARPGDAQANGVRLLFLVPAGIRPSLLEMAGAEPVPIPAERVRHRPAELRLEAGTYRRDQLGAFNVDEAAPVAVAMDHNKAVYEMNIEREGDLFNVQIPALDIVGWLIPSGDGHHSGVLRNEQDDRLRITARVLAGGDAVLFYVSDRPHGTILFRRARAASRPATEPADPDGPAGSSPAASRSREST
jgi:hypothetical protein